ncbi:MAG: 23S rRNA pseudouridine(1911/1915/1917) synthase RluD [Steroidobacteraceae bacterium]
MAEMTASPPKPDAAETLTATVPPEAAGRRLDQVLAELFPSHSRSRLKAWIEAGRVRLNGQQPKPRDRLLGGERVEVEPLAEPVGDVLPQSIPLSIVHEDRHLLVVDKPAGLVVHPGAGNPDQTLQNALLAHDAGLAALPRAGIVHRLDKDTSGLLVVARTLETHTELVRLLAAREISRDYEAVCCGVLTGGGTVEAPIGRHRSDRLRMTVRADGREAVTHYRLIERFRAHTHLRVMLETGRTHQIRVHLAHIGYPIVGDPLYGGRLALPRGASPSLTEALRGFRRQALHAARLAFVHPGTGQAMSFESPLPADLLALLAALREDAAGVAQV